MSITLHQFEMSHFNDKARWALAFKGLEHTRESYLPGPHMVLIRRLSGQVQTPVLVVDNDTIPGTAAIIDRLERDHPTPALYPSDPAERAEALAVQERFDNEVGPATRTVIFSELINEDAYLASMFGGSVSALKRSLYRASLPLAKPMIAKGNGTADPENVRRCLERTQVALDEIAERTVATGFMVGDSFSVADLTAAALMAPISNPTHPDMARPQPVPPSIQALVSNYADHPAVGWVNRMYAEHR
ncbi:MAG: glutathione S-transferase [Hyphomicrobiaceae bacterium]|jgi:glutathione S-transferase